MTDDQLHDAINGNTTAKAMANVGNDAGAAKVISDVLPVVVREGVYVGDRWIVAAFPDPTVGNAFLGGLELAAQNDPLIARVLKWLSPSEGGIDVGNASVRAQLDYLATLDIPGITDDAVTTLKALAESKQAITADQVSRAWRRYRPNGKVG